MTKFTFIVVRIGFFNIFEFNKNMYLLFGKSYLSTEVSTLYLLSFLSDTSQYIYSQNIDLFKLRSGKKNDKPKGLQRPHNSHSFH